MQVGPILPGRRVQLSERKIKRLGQFLEILRHKEDYWSQVEALRSKWELPQDGFPKWPDEGDTGGPDIVSWHRRWEEQGVDDPRGVIFEQVYELNREHGLPFPFDQILYDYLLHGEYDSPSTLAVAMEYDEMGERLAVIYITPETTIEDIRTNWEQVEVAQAWLREEWGVEITPPARYRRRLNRTLYVWRRVTLDHVTYDTAYEEWYQEHPEEEAVEPSAIIHAVNNLRKEFGLP
jgi:hypothetical protein